MKENPADKIKDTMWTFLMTGRQKANIPALKEACYNLIQLMTQKTAGQRKNNKSDISFDDAYMIENEIIIEAVCLVLSGELDKLC